MLPLTDLRKTVEQPLFRQSLLALILFISATVRCTLSWQTTHLGPVTDPQLAIQ